MTTPDETPFELILCGERFRLRAGRSAHARLTEVAEYVNRRVGEVRDKGGALTLQRAALMAAFQIAYELRELEDQTELSGDEKSALTQKLDDLIARIDDGLHSIEP